MKIQIITLFPEMFPPVLNASMLWKAQDRKLVRIEYINLRDFGLGKRKTVDDKPYGGGAGMLLMIEPLVATLAKAKKSDPKATVILMTPRGQRLTQKHLKTLAQKASGLIIICGRYEGYDERITKFVDLQISIGDYVLTGGEIPAMALVDGVVRLIPGVLGNDQSALIESFSDDLGVEYPQYTRPEVFRGQKVPKILLSGNHAQITKWRAK